MSGMYKYLVPAFLLFLPAFGFAQNSWEKKGSFPASKRTRAVAFSIGNRGYLATGEDTNDIVLNDLWEYDPGIDSWTQKASIPGPGRRDAVGFSIGLKGYVGTGIDAAEAWQGNILNDFWEYSPVTNTWTARAMYPGGWGGIYFATGFAVGGKGYVCCGKEGASNYSNELWEFNPATNTWMQKAQYPAGTRYGQMSFVLNGKGYVGCGTDENWYVTDFYEYNPATNTWLQKAPFPGSARAFGTGFAIGTRGYFGFGTDGGYRDDLFEYDPVSNTWSVKAPYGSEGRRSAPAFVLTGSAYVMTGKGMSGKHRDNWQYHPFLTGMEEQALASVNVYPNPATEAINFDVDEIFAAAHDDLSLQLLTTDGKIVASQELSGTHARMVNENWAPGVYLYALTDGTTTYGGGRILVR